MVEVRRYGSDYQRKWDEFVTNSKNGCFLFSRDFMDYHSDRFKDHSLLIYFNSKLVALLPANEKESIISSHAGLTFGGLITDQKMKGVMMLDVFDSISQYYKQIGFEALMYKAMPSVFHKIPSCEDLYALFRMGAKVVRRDLSSVIDLANIIKYNKGRKWIIKKAETSGVCVKESNDVKVFHKMLSEALNKHNACPVHSDVELELLMERFPASIKLYLAYNEDEVPVAGSLIFDYGRVVHTQYLATTDIGKEVGALDYLIDQLIKGKYSNRQFFSFGISTENNGKNLNNGLLAQKEGFGARSITHDLYEIRLDD